MREAELCNEGLGSYGEELDAEVLYRHEYGLERDLKSLSIPEFGSDLGNLGVPQVMEYRDLDAVSASDNYPFLGRSISRFNTSENTKLVNLRCISEAKPEELEPLLLEKIRQCGILFDFRSPYSDIESKKIKQIDLKDILDYLTGEENQIPISVYGDLIAMISKNILVPLCPQSFIPSESPDIPLVYSALEPAWYHLKFVYEIAVAFLRHPSLDRIAASKYIDMSFIAQAFELLSSPDPSEREILSILLRTIYAALPDLRPCIKSVINSILLQVTYEDIHHDGICAILDIATSIIGDPYLPLGAEDIMFFKKVLIPLHKPPRFHEYYFQLCKCIVAFILRKPSFSEDAIAGLVKYWPKTHSFNQIMILFEVEEIFKASDSVGPEILALLFRRIAQCISSPHTRTSQRALALCLNRYVAKVMLNNIDVVLPEVYNAIYEDATLASNSEKNNYGELVHRVKMFFMENAPEHYNHMRRRLARERGERWY